MSADQVRAAKAKRARQYLANGVTREDSDDELGLEDLPWQWIYETPTTATIGNPILGAQIVEEGQTASVPVHDGSTAQAQPPDARIIGAQMGSFRCTIGDVVMAKAEGNNEAFIGLICCFKDDEEEGKLASFMWFNTEKDIRNKQKKRTDFLSNEVYISPSWDWNPVTTINGKATILSPATYHARYPFGTVPRTAKEYGKVFICRRGCNTRTATYTEEFDWEAIYKGTEIDVDNLIERVKSETKATRKRRGEGKASEEADVYVDGNQGDLPETPRKKRKTSVAATPKSQRSTQKFTTPQKRIVIKKPLEFTPLGTRVLTPSHLQSPFQIARSQLHVAAVPDTLPCREEEFSTVYAHLEAAISDGSGSCIYISGTPGTGKTATVREVVAQLNASVMAEEMDDFIFVEINGMKVTDPHQSYSLLWEALRGERVSPSHALDLLEREFGNPSPRRVPCVVLMDELDQLVTKNQSVMYNFFNWPGLRHSRLIVLAVANTMDLPERTLSNKISSRLGLTRITFPGYGHEQLMKIIQSRLEHVPGNIVDPDAIQFASRKVAAVSGDARRALDICRRAVEIAEEAAQKQQREEADLELDAEDPFAPSTPSKRPRIEIPTPNIADPSPTSANTAITGMNTAQPPKPRPRVTISTIKQAIHEATSSPLVQSLRSLPLASKLFLAAVLARLRRSGLRETVLADVLDDAKRLADMAVETPAVRGYLLRDENALWARGREEDTGKVGGFGYKRGRPAGWKARAEGGQGGPVPRVLGLGAAAMELMEAGVIGLEARKGERTGKVRLNVGEEEIKLALRDDGEVRGLGFAG